MEALEKCPFEWEDTKKLAAAARERLGPLQVQQAEKIKAEAQVFEGRVTEYIASFDSNAPFSYEENADMYDQLDSWDIRTKEIEDEANAFQTREKLFELNVHRFKEVHLITRPSLRRYCTVTCGYSTIIALLPHRYHAVAMLITAPSRAVAAPSLNCSHFDTLPLRCSLPRHYYTINML